MLFNRHYQEINRISKKSVPDTKDLCFNVRDFVQQKRKRSERCIANKVLSFLADKTIVQLKIGSVEVSESKDYNTALRATRLYLKRNGFQ